MRANSFSIRGIDKWNNLPASVVTAPSVNFKSRLNTYWLRRPLKFEASCCYLKRPLKFEASCYEPGETARYWTQTRMRRNRLLNNIKGRQGTGKSQVKALFAMTTNLHIGDFYMSSLTHCHSLGKFSR